MICRFIDNDETCTIAKLAHKVWTMTKKFYALVVLSVRQSPSRGAERVALLQPGDEIEVIGDPVAADGLTWHPSPLGWFAEAADGEILACPADDWWRRSYSFMQGWEGDHCVHDPERTLYGITQTTYNDWRAAQQHAPADVCEALTTGEAEQIYRRWYWQRSGADTAAWPLCLAIFDFAVNAGVGQAQTFHQQAGDNVEVYMQLREAFYQTIAQKHPSLAQYLPGWLNRVAALKQHAGLEQRRGTENPPVWTAKVPLWALGE